MSKGLLDCHIQIWVSDTVERLLVACGIAFDTHPHTHTHTHTHSHTCMQAPRLAFIPWPTPWGVHHSPSRLQCDDPLPASHPSHTVVCSTLWRTPTATKGLVAAGGLALGAFVLQPPRPVPTSPALHQAPPPVGPQTPPIQVTPSVTASPLPAAMGRSWYAYLPASEQWQRRDVPKYTYTTHPGYLWILRTGQLAVWGIRHVTMCIGR